MGYIHPWGSFSKLTRLVACEILGQLPFELIYQIILLSLAVCH